MCGIAGIILRSAQGNLDKDFFERVNLSMKHRGPDGSGCWINEAKNIGFSHVRLSILDLSILGNQPMHYMDRYVITYNGEIYNYIELKKQLEEDGYRFKSETDTEVLMAMYAKYGEDCLQYVDGMFAFVIYDRKEKKIFGARDRFGEKPLHYCMDHRGFYFASEIKTLWEAGVEKRFNHGMLCSFLYTKKTYNPNSKTETFYEGINKIPLGHCFTISSDFEFELKPYWNLHDVSELPSDLDLPTIIDEVKQLVKKSVEKRLRSDVPVGSSLSGGVDSSIVVSQIYATNHKYQQVVSAKFPGSHVDESHYIDLLADELSLQVNNVFPSADGFFDHLDDLVRYHDEPFGSASIFAQFMVYKKARERGLIVMMDGQGADEVFAGYSRYFPSYYLERILKKGTAKDFRKSMQNNDTFPSAVINSSLMSEFSLLNKVSARIKSKIAKKNDIFDANFLGANSLQAYFDKYTPGNLRERLIHDQEYGALEVLLRNADRNSMASSVEVRLPYLSHELVEFVNAVRSEFKIHDGWLKYLLRKGYEESVNSEILWRKDKKGFQPPQATWMQEYNTDDLLAEGIANLKREGVYSKKLTLEKFKKDSKKPKNKNLIWGTLVSSSFLKK